jgi:hypothetical protein
MKLLIASSIDEIIAEIRSQLATVGIKGDQLTFVDTVDSFVKKLKTDAYHFIIADYAIEGADIWQLAKLINSAPLSAHTLPLFLIKETCELEIPSLLAREHSFSVVSLNEFGAIVTSAYHDNQSIGYPYYLAAWLIAGHITNDSGDLWQRAANYHSRTPYYNQIYREKLLQRATKIATRLDIKETTGELAYQPTAQTEPSFKWVKSDPSPQQLAAYSAPIRVKGFENVNVHVFQFKHAHLFEKTSSGW